MPPVTLDSPVRKETRRLASNHDCSAAIIIAATFPGRAGLDRLVKRLVLIAFLAICFSVAAQAQHGEIGFYGDYLRFPPASLGGAGLRGLLAIHRHVALELEGTYYFNRTFNDTAVDPTTGTTAVVYSHMHATNLLGGVSFSRPSRYVRPFLTMKMGLLTINPSSLPAPLVSTSEILNQIRNSHGNFAIYPGGGVEAYAGKWGFRLDIGDEIYFNNGSNSNLRITFGPNYVF